MTSRRPLLAALVASFVLLSLTACEEPAPGATVFSGSTSAHREAICWSFEPDQAVEQGDCSLELDSQPAADAAQALLEEIAVIPTTPGETVGISVDPDVAENGWVVSINGRSLNREPVTEKYFRFTMPPQPLRRGDAQLVISALTEDGSEVRGSWLFGLSDAQ
jgi:hypothetical protein